MKLYDTTLAVNPRRVRVFLAEKGIEVPMEQVDIMKGEHKTSEYRKISPLSQVPALILDDGQVLTESIAICRYFEGLQPEPNLMGKDALECAIIEMWQRRMELNFMIPVAMYYRHTHPAMAELETQIPEWGEINKERIIKMLSFIDRSIEGRDYIAGDRYTLADIVAMTTIDFARFTRTKIPEECNNLTQWYEKVSSRDSAQV
ncbi:MAG: glutathione S-transferase [Parvularculales bacterium]